MKETNTSYGECVLTCSLCVPSISSLLLVTGRYTVILQIQLRANGDYSDSDETSGH